MSDLRPRGIAVDVNGEERRLLFTLNVVDAIQDKYKKTLSEVLDDILNEDVASKTLRDVVAIMLNGEVEREKFKNPEAAIKEVTEKEVGWMISVDNRLEIIAKIMQAYGISLPEPDDDDPNREGGHQKS